MGFVIDGRVLTKKRGGMGGHGIAIGLLLLAAPEVRGNCESGGYSMHTIATYEPPETNEYLPYWSDDSGATIIVMRPEGMPRKQVEWLKAAMEKGPRFRVHGKECTVGPGGRRRLESKQGRGYRFKSCLGKPPPMAAFGYLRFGADPPSADFPSPLAITGATRPDPALINAIEAEIPNLDLRLDGSPADSMRIAADDITGIEYHSVKAGSGRKALEVVTAVLGLRNLDRLLSAEYVAAVAGGLEPGILREKLAQFPVIFFKRGDQAPIYVADGSSCGGHRLLQQAASRLKDLGPADRFEIEQAFDMDGDGGPDILVINSVAYLIEEGSLRVIYHPEGC